MVIYDMNIGDKIICKRNIFWTEYEQKKLIFTKSKIYTIDDMENDCIVIRENFNERFNFDDDIDSYIIKFKDTFYSKEELRQMKLKSL